MTRPIRIYPDPVLHEVCIAVTQFGPQAPVIQLVYDLKLALRAAGGAGLAAPQIGVAERVFVVDRHACKCPRTDWLVAVNPMVARRGDQEVTHEEACLSLPGQSYRVTRYASVTLFAQDLQGKHFSLIATGLLATALQHEVDHLNGRLICDRHEQVG